MKTLTRWLEKLSARANKNLAELDVNPNSRLGEFASRNLNSASRAEQLDTDKK